MRPLGLLLLSTTFAIAAPLDHSVEPHPTARECEAGGGCVTITREQAAQLIESGRTRTSGPNPCWKRT